MRIVHFAPFAPCGCGLYEAARDMIIADRNAGHNAQLVDSGITRDGVHQLGVPGQIDNRGGTEIKTSEPIVAYYADLYVAHAGYIDQWIVQTQKPIIWILHGRPAACFRPEQFGNGNSYSCLASIARWPRVKKVVTFWDYHIKFWEPAMPMNKLVCFDAPPIDEKRFSKEGEKHDFGIMGSKYNIMIAESWREDVDIYEIMHGMIELSKIRQDVKFHIYGMDKLYPCWEYLIGELKRYNACGELWARRPNIEEIYRAADILLSPQRIVTRTIGEALSCGTPVIAAHGCDLATYTTKPDEPEMVAETIEHAIEDLIIDKELVKEKVKQSAQKLSLENYSISMNKLYEDIVNN